LGDRERPLLHCSAAAEAIKRARAQVTRGDIEIWLGERRIAAVKAEDK
jgi:hypothetical protein